MSAPTAQPRDYLLFRPPSEEPIVTSRIVDGVSIEGQAGFIVGPGSIVPTGTYRGTLAPVARADFQPTAAIAEAEDRRPLALFQAANLVPTFTSSGERFLDFLFRDLAGANVSEARRIRLLILREALSAGLNDRQAASVVWWSSAGDALRQAPDGLAQLWSETSSLSPGDSGGNDTASISLLSEQERTIVADSPWWGSRYVEWAQQAAPLAPTTFHRLYRWLALAHMFGPESSIPKPGEAPRLELSAASLGSTATIEAAKVPLQALVAALHVGGEMSFREIPDRSAVTGHLQGSVVAALRAAHHWSPEAVGAVLWALDGHRGPERDVWVEEQLEALPNIELAPIPMRLVIELWDARESTMRQLGSPPFAMLMEQNALERHSALKSRLSEVLEDRSQIFRFADNVRRAATLVAHSEGAGAVTLLHELHALEQAEEWLGSLVWMERSRLHAFA